jgi:hypothetical protein
MTNRESATGMACFGITGAPGYSAPVPKLRQLSNEIGRGRSLAQFLWKAGALETRALASIVAVCIAIAEAMMKE